MKAEEVKLSAQPSMVSLCRLGKPLQMPRQLLLGLEG